MSMTASQRFIAGLNVLVNYDKEVHPGFYTATIKLPITENVAKTHEKLLEELGWEKFSDNQYPESKLKFIMFRVADALIV